MHVAGTLHEMRGMAIGEALRGLNVRRAPEWDFLAGNYADRPWTTRSVEFLTACKEGGRYV